MANRRAGITQAELARVLRAHRDAGIPVARTVVTPTGHVTIYTINDPRDDGPNPWDEA